MLKAAIQADDWTILSYLAVLLVFCMLSGPSLPHVMKSVGWLFRTGKSTSELHVPGFYPFHSFLLALVSCAAISMATVCANSAQSCARDFDWHLWLVSFAIVSATFLFKQTLSHLVNKNLYRKQKIAIKPSRWNLLRVSVLVFAAALCLLFATVSFFFNLSGTVVFHLLLLLLFVLEIVWVVKIKSSLFPGHCGIFGILLYLCTLEIGPVALAAVLLCQNTVIL